MPRRMMIQRDMKHMHRFSELFLDQEQTNYDGDIFATPSNGTHDEFYVK